MNFCSNPFTSLHVHPESFVTCCPSWFTDTNQVVVRGKFENLWDVWNHKTFQNLRNEWVNGSNQLCKPCPVQLLKSSHIKEKSFQPVMSQGPTRVEFANDLTCNLHCWTCRSRPIIEKRQEEIYRQTYQVLDTFSDSLKFISAIGSGDPFASPAWLRILQNFEIGRFPDLEIELFTNGLLIPKHWESLGHIHDNISTIKMSVDAATKPVYERTRLGGNFEQLEEALEFISKLNKKLILNMVVQSDNFTDIPEFIRRAVRFKASQVNLTLMKFWSQMRGGKLSYNDQDLSNPNHPKYKEFRDLLSDNEGLLSNPIVDASKLTEAGCDLVRNQNNT